MQMAIDQVVDVVPVGHRLVAATRTVNVSGVVSAAGVVRGAARGVSVGDLQAMLVAVIAVGKVEVSVVQVVDVVSVLDRRVAAAGSVDVIGVVVGRVIVVAHGSCLVGHEGEGPGVTGPPVSVLRSGASGSPAWSRALRISWAMWSSAREYRTCLWSLRRLTSPA